MFLTQFIVVGIVCWRNFQTARSEFRVNVFISNYRDCTIDQRNIDFFPHQVLVACVLRVDTNSNVCHDRLWRSEEHTSELQSRENLVCRLLREKKKKILYITTSNQTY